MLPAGCGMLRDAASQHGLQSAIAAVLLWCEPVCFYTARAGGYRIKRRLLCCRLLAVCFGLLSLAVVLAEATISPKLPNLSLFSRVLQSMEGNQAATEMLCFAFLAYPIACAYYGLYKYACLLKPSDKSKPEH